MGVTAVELAEFTHGDSRVEQPAAARVVRGCRCSYHSTEAAGAATATVVQSQVLKWLHSGFLCQSIICVQLKNVSNLCKPTKYKKKTNLTSLTLLIVDYTPVAI